MKKGYSFWVAVSVIILSFITIFFLWRDRKFKISVTSDKEDSDAENIANDWKNVFGDLSTSFEKMKSQANG